MVISKDVGRQEEPALCRRCGQPFTSRMHVEGLIRVERALGYRYEMPDSPAEHYQWICPPCRRAMLVKDNTVIGFEPWLDFPFNQGKLCPKGVKRYLQGAHPDRLLHAYERDPAAPGGFKPMDYDRAIARVAAEIDRIQSQHGRDAFAILTGRTGTVTGIVGAAGGLGGFFPPLVMGLVRQTFGGYALGFVLLALVALICLILNQRVLVRNRPNGHTQAVST